MKDLVPASLSSSYRTNGTSELTIDEVQYPKGGSILIENSHTSVRRFFLDCRSHT